MILHKCLAKDSGSEAFGVCEMMKFSVLALCAATVLAGCSSGPSGPQLGPDGRPLPVIYKISKADEAEMPVRMRDSLNTLRAARGLGPVEINPALTNAAMAHSRDMSAQARPWHFGSDGSSPLYRAQRAGYMGHFQGELVAETYESDLDTLGTWAGQPDTLGVLMDPAANELGFGWYQEPSGKIWWTLALGDRNRGPIANVTATALGRTVSSEMDGVVGQ